MSHKTLITSQLTSLGSAPSDPSYLFASIFEWSRMQRDMVISDISVTLQNKVNNSTIASLMTYSNWSRLNWSHVYGFTSYSKKQLLPIPIKDHDEYIGKRGVVAYRKVFGTSPDKFVSGIKNQKNPSEYTYVSIVFGIPASTKDPYMLALMFDVIKRCKDTNTYDLTLESNHKDEQRYVCNITGSISYELHEGTYNNLINGHASIESTHHGLVLTRQLKDSYEVLRGFSISGYRDMYSWRGKKEDPTLRWYKEMDKKNTGLYLPISFEDLRLNRKLIGIKGLSNVVNAEIVNVTVVHIPWWAEGIFKWIFIIIILIIEAIIEVVTFGSATPAVAAADVGFAALFTAGEAAIDVAIEAVTVALTTILTGIVSATVISILATFIVNLVLYVVITIGLKDALKPLLGSKIANLITGMMMVAISAPSSFTKLMSSPMKMLSIFGNIANSVTQFTMKSIVTAKEKTLSRKEKELGTYQDRINQAYQDAPVSTTLTASDFNDIRMDMTVRYNLYQRDNMCQMAVLTGYDIADMQLNAIKEHYTNGTQVLL